MVSKSVSKIESRRDRGVFHLEVMNTVERLDALKAKHDALRDGCDPLADVGVRSSGSYGIGRRSFRKWDEKERRFRLFFYDAMQERWIEQDTRPRWQQDLDDVRARLAAKGKLPRGGR